MEEQKTNENSEEKASVIRNSDKGIAAIKALYSTTKEKFHECIDSGWKGEKRAFDAKNPEGASEEARGEQAEEPQTKKVKLEEGGKDQGKKKARGQFKSRPHVKPQSYDDKKLCPSIVQECASKCFYGDKCKFFHNISEYMALKPADIGERCYIFDTFGKCRYGLTCRFAKAHIGENFKNLVNQELLDKMEGRSAVRNNLNKDLQHRLRKKQVSFKASEAYLREMNRKNQQRSTAQMDVGSKPVASGNATKTEELSEAVGRSTAADVPKEEGNVETLTAVKEVEANTEAEGISSSVETVGLNVSVDPKEQEHHGEKTPVKTLGVVTDADIVRLRPCEKKQVDFRDKLYLAPLTTCGNLPFRRICKRFGADITCGEMAVCTNLLQGQTSEWALLKRHESEDLFGVQLEGSFPDTMTKCAELLNKNIEVDFVDINSGCPIDLVYNKGGGCGLMTRTKKFEQIVRGMNSVLDVPLTVKIRTGVQEKNSIAHKLIPDLKSWGVSLITLHGRSREQRYTKVADWNYISTCSKLASPVPLFGNGDILSYEDAMKARETGVSGIMIARGALIKPWIFTEIKEQRHWDISSSERFEILKDFTNFGLEQWGSDTQGVEKTRTFLLEWLSFLCRYIPVGLLERVPQKINERPPYYVGRDYLETVMASQHVGDWIKISEMLLGPVPTNFTFLPKHKANAYK
nr:PREDICTED: tRNA-dihydrouridine(47) synthase [NAD(P)(+)]-like [Lepisosteus oculatus]XP_015213590.1 PREDICTED: tRNA-dihydrouridine(47) synthase [NAD(P)(+)]-like [Lepisosteus oculatus]